MKNDAIDKVLMLTKEQVAELLQCSDRHITNLRERNEIPKPVYLGRLVRWPRQVIEQWVSDGCPAISA